MSHLIEYEEASDEVRAVYDDIRATRKTDYINNFWKAIANHPPTLQCTWQGVKEVMTTPDIWVIGSSLKVKSPTSIPILILSNCPHF